MAIRTPPAHAYTATIMQHDDGRYYAVVKHSNGDTVLMTPPKQQYENESDVADVLVAAFHYGPHVIVDSHGRTLPQPKFGWRRTRGFRRRKTTKS